uniref:tRNA-dihydrouridine(47) synthase [NAD(P)(+)] n=1 Tax=Physcomitrium patens TaxID=3218 RepID=A0A7I4AGK9_PHYPA
MTTVRSPRNSLSKRGYYSNLSVILDTPLLFLAKSIVLTDHGENNAPIEGAFSTPEISNPVAAVTSVNRKAKHQLRCERKERRPEEEGIFRVQICGSNAGTLALAAEPIERECSVDFDNLYIGCPIDVVVNESWGSSLLTKSQLVTNFENSIKIN